MITIRVSKDWKVVDVKFVGDEEGLTGFSEFVDWIGYPECETVQQLMKNYEGEKGVKVVVEGGD